MTHDVTLQDQINAMSSNRRLEDYSTKELQQELEDREVREHVAEYTEKMIQKEGESDIDFAFRKQWVGAFKCATDKVTLDILSKNQEQ